MATYNLNEVLKARAAANGGRKKDEEVKLDDVSRVKVLSPGRQVFKRFIRNRLAVFGSVMLIVLFVFSFFGPLLYSYGQKQIFYKYDVQNVNYALAKENTAYNGYDVDDSVTVERAVVNSMNSNIKAMIAADTDTLTFLGNEGGYQIQKLGDDIYMLSAADLTGICTIGTSMVKVGTYSAISKTMDFANDEISGLEAAAVENVKGNGGEFTFDGVTYSFEKSAAKSYEIYTEMDGIIYMGQALSTDVEVSLLEAIDAGATKAVVDGDEYAIISRSGGVDVYQVGEVTPAKVFTRLTLDTFEVGASVPEEFRVGALLAAYDNGSFSAGGQDYTVRQGEGVLIIYDAANREYAEFNTFSIRRYSGEDTMEYGLKKALTETIEEMTAAGQKTGMLTYRLPQQGENGEYTYDEDGKLQYQETEMVITQRDTGEYVINCDQVNFIINMFDAPSGAHILGTDGDGFDVLARIMYGGRISLMVGFVVVFIETFLGVIMGGLAGYYGGWVDNLIMRLVDIFYCLPSLPIMIILGAMMDAMRMDTYIRLIIMMAALGIMGWAGVARLVRGQILSLREQEFMVATEATGIKVRARIFHHLVPNVMPQLIVTATMGIGGVILTESTLSFLGLGVKHPLATWGTIINSVSSASAMAHYAFIWIPVGLLICLTVIAFNFVGDGLRDAYDPKSKR